MPENELENERDSERAAFDYSYVNAVARIALYDDMRSAPRVTTIEPAATTDFIGNLAAEIARQSKEAGGNIAYTTILEVTENFIHAQFREIVVSIFDEGNTIRFADQGPGIPEKDKATQPGFSSATEPMKRYIRGVGSGLPIVSEWLKGTDGSIVIEDNLKHGAVVTISLAEKPSGEPSVARSSGQVMPHIPLKDRERSYLLLLAREGDLGITDMKNLTGDAVSTISATFSKLGEWGLVEKLPNKKRTLTEIGEHLMTNF